MKNDKKIFFKNTFSLYLMNIVKLFFPILTLPYLTRVMSTETYGAVTYVKSLVVYVQLLIDFGFLLSTTREIVTSKGDKIKIGNIVGDTIIEKLILVILASVLYVTIMIFVPIMREYWCFSLLYLCAVSVNIFIFDFLFRGIEKMNLVSIPYVISKSIVTVLTFIIIKGDNSLLFIPILELIGNTIAAIFSFAFVKKLSIRISFSNCKKWIRDLKESFIYFISNFATTVFGALTTVIAGFYVSIDEIAYWGICMQILSAAKSLYNPITNSLYPLMIRNKDINFIKRISKLMIIPMIIGCVITMFAGNFIMAIIGGAKYVEAGEILKYLLPAFVFSFYSMLYGWPVLGSIGKVKETTISTIITSVIQIFGIVILIFANIFNLKWLAVCCSTSETILFIIRYFIYLKNKKEFTI